MHFGIPTWRQNSFIFELLFLAIGLYLSPFIPKIGWYLPQAFAFILGIYFFSVLSIYIILKYHHWLINLKIFLKINITN
jgi:hypothetical protein